MKLRNKLKYWRHKLEMNQKEFAEFLAVSRSQISLWERNEQGLSLESAWKIKKKLDCTIDELYEESL